MTEKTYPWIEEVVAPAVESDSHVTNIQIADLMFQAWMHYLSLGLDLDREAVFGSGWRPIVRAISAQFEAEVSSCELLRCGVRAESRSRSAFTLEQQLWRADGNRSVASGTVVLVSIEAGSGKVTAIPETFWKAVESTEGRAIPASQPARRMAVDQPAS